MKPIQQPGPFHLTAVLLGILCALPGPGDAGQSPARPRTHVRSRVRVSPGSTPAQASLRYGLDDDGAPVPLLERDHLRLSPEEARMVSRSTEGLVVVWHPDGSRSMDLQGRFQDLFLVHVHPDGRKSFQCLENAQEAARELTAPAETPMPRTLEDR